MKKTKIVSVAALAAFSPICGMGLSWGGRYIQSMMAKPM